MPPSAPKPCHRAGCSSLVTAASPCLKHPVPKRWQDDATAQMYDRRRGTASQRGYGARWRRIREAYIAAEPLCEWCKAQGLVTRATEVDHIIPLGEGGAIDGALQSMCHPCHMRKTRLDVERGKRRASGDAQGLRGGRGDASRGTAKTS